MDLLEITALRTTTHIGVHAWEQRIKQVLLIDLHIPLDLTQCHDTLDHTLNYDTLCQCVTEYVESNAFTLIETVAENIATRLKTTFPLITTLTVRISKPHAIPTAGNISITINR
ncbi:MAG: dihydroneopterin aldolase [Legionellales bacterium RIFCSPHIGHO2_12_FULL_42_9]|nr:MAG: dihydroneopterin aldolase [Legionellales bacterium RIFCSPHIGHO2_12_FULL_42_9]